MFRRILVFAPIAIAAQYTFAAAPSVTAMLSDSQPSVGQMVQMEIKVNGAQNANVPETISIDGLEIHQTGTSRQFEMHNFDVTSSVTYNYTILPLKAGHFRIPPQTVRVGNDSLRTPELALNVEQGSSNSAGAPGGSTGSGQRGQASVGSKAAFAELVIAKKDAYVGEMIPAVIRLGFDMRARGRLQEGPELSAQGFTTQKLQQPRENLETIGGRTYQVYTFKTALAAARPGKFELGPVTAKAVVVLPRRPTGTTPRARPRSPFDIFNMDDPFSDPFFADPFGSMGERTELPIRSETVELNIKPLPPNAPPNFSGAVGNFIMSVDAKPKTVQVGDPITVTSTITGRGNFDRMNSPALEEERGWHKYPPSSKFQQDDDVGISGVKTFEMVLAPNEKKLAVPPLVFAYFDPAKESYVTLRSDAVPITVEGGSAPAPSVATAPATGRPSATPASAAAKPAASAKPADILYQMNDLGRVRSFAPIYTRPVFWIAQLAPLILLLGFVSWKIRQAKSGDREAQRLAARHHEMTRLLRELRHGDVSPQVYFSQATRVVQLKTAVAKNINPNAVDAETAANAFGLGDGEKSQLSKLFERSDELSFSGSGNGADKISKNERQEVLRLVESLRA
ncbi:MAG TPA: BatD family protein [Chthoniobacterales bacterium]|nr:BatD family protein [Chthoniobacterales bacterium]